MEIDDETLQARAFADSRFGWQAVDRLRRVFVASSAPMLLVDDRRFFITGNDASTELFGRTPPELAWQRMDDFTASAERGGLQAQWTGFLFSGTAEGWYQLALPGGALSMEFSATANVLPGRHLVVFLAPDRELGLPAPRSKSPAGWTPVPIDAERKELTAREREVLTLIASGLQGAELADRLFLSSETIKSHVSRVMEKLGARTRAHAVAIALVTEQITWEQ